MIQRFQRWRIVSFSHVSGNYHRGYRFDYSIEFLIYIYHRFINFVVASMQIRRLLFWKDLCPKVDLPVVLINDDA